jgi:predicted RNase H-like nuclease (RuvC/YqgF family)
MNPLFLKSFTAKKKRERDPNAPPPPTLLGQVKELRITRETIDQQAAEISVLRSRLEYLEAKIRRLESYTETVKDFAIKARK